MPQIGLPVIDGLREDAHVFRRSEGSDDPTAPFLVGLGRVKGDVDWLCGSCSLLLAESINPRAIHEALVFVCPTCGANNGCFSAVAARACASEGASRIDSSTLNALAMLTPSLGGLPNYGGP